MCVISHSKACEYVCARVNICIYVYVYVCVYKNIYGYGCIYAYNCVFMYVYTHTCYTFIIPNLCSALFNLKPKCLLNAKTLLL